MRRTEPRPVDRRFLVASLALVALATGLRPATAADGVCNRWDLEVVCTAPPHAIVGEPFEASATVKNTGDMTLENVTVQLRTDLGARCVEGLGAVMQATVPKLEPGGTKTVSAKLIADNVGAARVIGTARDAASWASANCACTIDVLGLPAIQSEMSDKDTAGAEKGIFTVGESFQYVLSVTNDVGSGLTPDLHVLVTLPKELQFVSGQGENGVTITGSGQSAETTTFTLAPNKTQRMSIVVKVLSAPPSNLVQTRASIQTTNGIEVARETESTTLKPAP